MTPQMFIYIPLALFLINIIYGFLVDMKLIKIKIPMTEINILVAIIMIILTFI